MLKARRGAVLIVVLGIGTSLLALATWGALRVGWGRAALRSEWDGLVLEFAAVEVRQAARGRTMPRERVDSGAFVTTNRLVGRWEVREVGPGLWRVRWGVGGAGGLWREGAWSAVGPPPVLGDTAPGKLIPIPGLPLDR